MRVFMLLLIFSTITSNALADIGSQKLDSISGLLFKNTIRPFSSDGCSRFPDGVPGISPDQWLNCCVQHDVAYWQGGTSEQRADADKNLGECVTQSGASFVGPMMRLGVRLGGNGDLPTTWNWGYGWVLYRGYGPLSESEIAEVQGKLNTVKTQMTSEEIIAAPVLRTRDSVTGNYCVDLGALEIQKKLKKEFEIENVSQTTLEKPPGFFHTFKMKVKHCEKDFVFQIHTLKRNSCNTPMTELVARGQIRFLSLEQNNSCQ